MQTNLEKKGIEARNTAEINRTYSVKDEYSVLHPNAISNGDEKGKGTGVGGHTHTIPGQSTLTSIDYSNLDTLNGGGKSDIEKRNFLKNISKYNENNQYGAHLIDTSANEGQVRF